MEYLISRRGVWLRMLMASVVLSVLCPGLAWSAGNTDDLVAGIASNSIMPFLAVGELSLFADGKNAKPEMIQGAKALVATGLVTEFLKCTVREKRPESDSLTSFPSGHTSAAFAMATVLSEYHPKYQWLAYGAASAIGWSRVERDDHRWRDVLAGAAIGHFVAKQFVGKRITLSPAGLSYNTQW